MVGFILLCLYIISLSLFFFLVNLDDCWQGDRDPQGSMQPNPQTFPSGLRALADYIHSKQLKFGLFSSKIFTLLYSYTCICKIQAYIIFCYILGPESKTWNGRSGSYGHEEQDAHSYASWTVDYLTYEQCQRNKTVPRVSFPLMRDALNATGRPIFYSIIGKFTH